MAHKDLPVLREHKAQREQLARKVLKEHKGVPVLREHKVQTERKVIWALKAQLAHKA